VCGEIRGGCFLFLNGGKEGYNSKMCPCVRFRSWLMDVIVSLILLIAGFTLLWKCAELLVSGAVSLAERLGVSPIIIGLTVVAMGTSAPEAAASIAAALRGQGDVAIGDVYGSNIANLALVGGLIALLRPVGIRISTIKREIPVMIFAGLLLLPFLLDRDIVRAEGIFLLVVFLTFILITIHKARRQVLAKPDVVSEVFDTRALKSAEARAGSLKLSVIYTAAGLAGVAFGADLAVRGAVRMGLIVGLSPAVIGLTIVAVGTSLPELVTCVVASLRRQDDISIGNLVGSNIFNTLLVVGAAGTISPFKIAPRLAGSDYWVMIGASAGFTVLALFGRRRLGRRTGAILLFGYAAYMIYLFGFKR